MSTSRDPELPDWVKEALEGVSPATDVDTNVSVLSQRKGAAWPLMLDAAVVGTFLPRMLGRDVVDPRLRDEAERAVLGFAESTQTPDGIRWILRPTARVEVLNEAAGGGGLAQSIERTRADFTDPFSTALRRCLEAPLTEADLPRDPDALEATRNAVAALSGVHALAALPPVEELDRRVELARLLAQFARMVGEKAEHPGEYRFFGRDAQLKALRDYCDGVEAESIGERVTRLGSRVAQAVSGVTAHVVWGVGGVGKTTLVAMFMLEHARAAKEQFPFAYLDFDRSTINASHMTPLLAEMCAQVSVQFPGEIGGALDDLRERLRALEPKTELLSNLETLSLLRPYAQEFRRHVDGLLQERERRFAPRPFLLVFDTFEVVQYESVLVKHLEGFVELFNDASQRPWKRLRLIISGRQSVPGFAGDVEDVPLGPLDRTGSADMLQALASDSGATLSREDAEEIVTLIAKALSGKPQEGVHPLHLHLVGTVIDQIKKEQQRDGKEFSIQPLLKELGEENVTGESGRTFIIGVLVRRILGHVVDTRVRALADPGLVVRRITEDVIRQVMAPSTNTPGPDGKTDEGDAEVSSPWQLSEEEAADIYKAFRREVTLIELDDDNTLRHRPDIRQEMLPLIKARRPQRFAAIHQRAFEYFAEAATRDSADDKAAAEAIYHGLWAGQSLDRVNGLWRSNSHFRPRIDAAEFVPGSPANVFIRAKAAGDLTVEEVRLLPREVTLDWLTARAELFLKVERVNLETMSVIRSAAGQNFEDLRDRPALAATVARMLYRSGDWQDAMLLLSRALDRPEVWRALVSSRGTPELWSLLRTYVAVVAKSGQSARTLDTHADALAAAPDPLTRLEFVVHRALAAARADGDFLPASWRAEVLSRIKQVPREEWRSGLRVLRLAILLLGDDPEWLLLYAQSVDRLPRDRRLGTTMLKVVEPLIGDRPELVERLVGDRRTVTLVDQRTFDEVDEVWRGAARQSFARLGIVSRMAFLQLLAEDHQEWVRPLGNALTRELAGTLGPELLKWLGASGFGHGPGSSAELDGLSYAQTAYESGQFTELALGLKSFGTRHQSVASLIGGEYPRNVFEVADAFLACRAAILERWTAKMDSEASVTFETVHATELERVLWRRQRALDPSEQAREAAPVAADGAAANAHRIKPFGLAFSGGGIRSATFNLGILQGLAEHDLLRRVDYLSTVSGGGYIGSWLHGFIKHHCDSDLAEATCRLSPTRKPVEGPPLSDPIAFLRKYSNYLAPSPGLFSADTWVIGFIWLRNVLLNQLILLPALAAPMLLALLAVFGQQQVTALSGDGWQWDAFHIGLAAAVALSLLTAAVGAAVSLRSIVRRLVHAESKVPPDPFLRRLDEFVNASLGHRLEQLVAPLLFLAAVILGCADLGAGKVSAVTLAQPGVGLLVVVAFSIPYLVLALGGGFVKYFRAMHGRTRQARIHAFLYLLPMTLVCAALSFWLLHEVLELTRTWYAWDRVAVVPVLVCLAVQAGIVLFVGLMGADYPDGAREWVARIGTRLLLICAVWLGLFAVAVWGPWAIAWSLANYGKTTVAALTGWIATTGLGVLAGRSAASGGVEPEPNPKPNSGRVISLLVAVAPTVFMIGYLLLISLGVHLAADALLGVEAAPAAPAPVADSRLTIGVSVPEAATPIEVSVNRSGKPSSLDEWLAGAGAFAEGYFKIFALPVGTGALGLVELLFGCLAIVVLASQRININEFSLHHFYKNRLVRCYLGASHGAGRRPNPLTGFDPGDDFPLSTLRSDGPVHLPGQCEYCGPYPIVNATLNLNVGSELAQQERKGASFVFTPEYCGFEAGPSRVQPRPAMTQTFDQGGYRRTWGADYGYSAPEGPTVGQVMAISGAAANPNSGYATSNAMAFLLTVFDARLGWWLGNPRWRKSASKPGPSFALGSLLSELFAQTTARSKFINLSDGGHFDNLGLYELVRRRCRYIIVGDGEQDGDLTFGSLGGAIRKCRADFGVEIAIDPHPIRLKNGRSTAHCVVGTITYPEVDPLRPEPMTGTASDGPGAVREATGRARGWLLYLKTSLTGNEPADVIEYQARNPEFPHQSTADQFFAESQFESYRRLGLHVLREAFEGVLPKVGDVTYWIEPASHELAPPATSVAADQQKCKDSSRANRVPIDLTDVFQKLMVKWYPPVQVSPDGASRLNDQYGALVQQLSDPALQRLMPDVLADLHSGPPWPLGQPEHRQLVYMVEQLGLMENVFFAFGFEHAANRANPRNRGWMKVFRQWVSSDQFYRGLWPRVQGSYNPVFQQFIGQLRDEPIDDAPIPN